MKIFHTLQKVVADLMPKIYELPFNRELANGSLPVEKFAFYLVQDALYLADFAIALTLTTRRLPRCHQTEHFVQLATDAIKTERELRKTTLEKYPMASRIPYEQSPFCFTYTNYLLKMAHVAPVEEAVASLLPCFWVYQQLGQNVFTKKTVNNPYQDWIDLYTGSEFSTSVDLVIATINELGRLASEETQKNMMAAFKRSTQLEWYFWQGAYVQEMWLCA